MYGVPTTISNPANLNKQGFDYSVNPFKIASSQGATTGLLAGAPSWQINQYGTTGQPTNTATDNHPVLSSDGSWVSSTSGQPWHGTYQNPNGTVQYFSNGQQVTDVGQVGLQKPQIGVQQIAKNPALSSQVAGAIDQNATATGMLSKSFADYLKEAQNVGAQGQAQLAKSESAINPAGTISRLNADVSQAGTDLNKTLSQYVTSQNQNQQDIAGANQNYQQQQDAALKNLGTNLTTENQNYATAAQNSAAQAYANALKQTNLYQLQSGTPTSGSGQLSNRYIADFNSVNLPLQQDLANRALATTNQLYGLGSNLQNQYLGNLQNQYAGVNALNQDVANRFTSGNQYLTGLDQQTAQYIQGLQQQVATMAPELRAQYLQSLGVPIQMAQAILSGNTANLSQLAGLDQQANWYNAYGQYQNNAPSFISPRVTIPSVGGGGGGTTATGGFAPLVSDAMSQQNDYLAQQQAWLQSPAGQQWQQQNRTATSSPAANNYGVPGVDSYGNPVSQNPAVTLPNVYT